MKAKTRTINHTQIHQRKIELIKRDPLTQEYNNLHELEKQSRKNYSGSLVAYESKTLNRLEEIAKEIRRKWNVGLIRRPASSDGPLPGLQINARGNNTVTDMTDYVIKQLIPKINRRTRNSIRDRDQLKNNLKHAIDNGIGVKLICALFYELGKVAVIQQLL